MKATNLAADCKSIRTILRLSQSELGEILGVSFALINRIENGEKKISEETIEALYSFAYSNKIRPIKLNQIKAQLALDRHKKVVFHGSREGIQGSVSPDFSRRNLDFGKGFYCGESLEQAATFIAPFPKGFVYVYKEGDLDSCNILEMKVDEDWMLAVSYFRGQLEAYSGHPRISKLKAAVEKADIIIAPIADNTMYTTMDQFARGNITTLQAMYALSASELGFQHVFKSQKACDGLKMIDLLYLCKKEREDYNALRKASFDVGQDKVRFAKEAYRRQGLYVEELLK